MGQAGSVEAGQDDVERKHAAVKKGKLTWKKLKQLKKHYAAVVARNKACKGSIGTSPHAGGKDAGLSSPAATKQQSSKLTVGALDSYRAHDDIPSAGSVSDSIPESAEQLHGSDSATAAAFVQWVQRQSSNKHVSIEDFLLQYCKEELSSQDALGVEDILAAAAAGGVTMPKDICRTASRSSSKHVQDLEVEPYAPYIGHVRGAAKAQCHDARVEAADGINALRTTRDGEIEAMLRLLCNVFQTETASVALLTGEAIYITAACGILRPGICPDRWGFCGWSFLNAHHELLVVEDLDADARFSVNYFVMDPLFSLKFYVAAPLVTSNGHRLGTLCVMGQQPRKFDPLKAQMLANLAEMLVRQLEYRWVMALQEAGNTTGLKRDLSCYSACYLVLDLSSSPWKIMHMNEPARTATGVDWSASYDELPSLAAGRRETATFEGLSVTTLFDVSAASITWGNSVSGSSSSWEFRLSGLRPTAGAPAALHEGLAAAVGPGGDSSCASYTFTCKLAYSDGLDEAQPFFIGVPSWLALSEEHTWGRNLFFARLEIDVAEGSRTSRTLGSLEHPQQQQQAFHRDSARDSVEELMTMTARVLKQHVNGDSAGHNSSSSIEVSSDGSSRRSSLDSYSSAAITPCWLPRGMSTLSREGSNFSGSLLSSSAPDTPSAAAGGVSPFDSASEHISSINPGLTVVKQPAAAAANAGSTPSGSRTSSVKSFQTVTSSGSLAPVVCRGLPVPGLLMGPLVGRGSYGKVYRGLWRGRPVAVKIIDDISSLKLTKTGEPLEISLTKNLKQLGIMSTLTYTYSDASAVPTNTTTKAAAAGRSRGGDSRLGRRVCWMLFEYCDKGVLADAVVRGWFRTVPDQLKGAAHLRVIGLTALEIAVAMKHLHDQGVLHGDLCGGNVMLTKSATNEHGFTAKVGDFGLARINSSDGSAHPVERRLADNAYGTITHQPQEVLSEGGVAFTPAADVYAWGVLLWEMLTGTRAWAGMAAPAVVCQVVVLKRSLATPKNLPHILEDLLSRALSPKPSVRPSFSEIVEVLTGFVQRSRAVDWEQWQGAIDAAQVEQAAAIAAWEGGLGKEPRCCLAN